jgi:hypothetical protein
MKKVQNVSAKYGSLSEDGSLSEGENYALRSAQFPDFFQPKLLQALLVEQRQ